jgi:hypothetical protein
MALKPWIGATFVKKGFDLVHRILRGAPPLGDRFSPRRNARHASPDYSGLGWFRVRTEGAFAAGRQVHFCWRIRFQGGNAATGLFPDGRRMSSIVHGKENISCSVTNDDV